MLTSKVRWVFAIVALLALLATLFKWENREAYFIVWVLAGSYYYLAGTRATCGHCGANLVRGFTGWQ